MLLFLFLPFLHLRHRPRPRRRVGKRTGRGDCRCMARNNGAREGGRGGIRMDSRTNGALLLLLRRLVAGRTRPVEILRFVVARKNPEDWLKEGGQGTGGRWRGMRAMVTSGFAMRRPVPLRVGPQLQHIRRRDEIDISDITVSLVKKKGREK